jgi:tellurite methyltransferase
MPATSTEWDARHRSAPTEGATDAAVILRELLPLLPTGPALDLACGGGRNAFLLASRGQPVTAIDWSPVGLEMLEGRALAAGMFAQRRKNGTRGVCAANQGIETVCADLRSVHLARREFALILCINYLERSLFAKMSEALQPGGSLLYETYTTEQLKFASGPRNPEYLLRPGELREAFPGLEIVFYRELRAGQGIATLLTREPLK